TELQTDRGFLNACNRELFADRSRTQRLHVRNGQSRSDGSEYGIPHFFMPRRVAPPDPHRFVIEPDNEPKEKDRSHETRIDLIVKHLQRIAPRQLFTRDFRDENQNGHNDGSDETIPSAASAISNKFILADVSGYNWGRRNRRIPVVGGSV